MKIVSWKDRYVGNVRRVKREVTEIDSINGFIVEKIKDVNFNEEDVLISHTIEQIRIPSVEFEKLQPEVQSALREESLPPHDGYHPDDRWMKENYWTNCDAYIFDFKSYRIRIGVEWGYDGVEGCNEEYEFVEFSHPFIGEFISCVEGRWGEADEEENIIKYYNSLLPTNIRELPKVSGNTENEEEKR